MSLFVKQKLATESTKYVAALARLKEISTKMPLQTEADRQRVLMAIEAIKDNLKYAKSRRLQLVLNNSNLRKSIEKEIGLKTRPSRDQFVRQVRQNPNLVLTIPGVAEVVNIVKTEQDSAVGGLWAVMLEYQKMVNKESKEDRKIARTDAFVKLTQKRAALEAAVQDISNRNMAATQTLITAVASGVIMIIEEVSALTGSAPPAPPTGETVDTSAVDRCLSAAAQKRDACKASCPPGDMGATSRGICEATYLAEIARCLL